MNILCLGHTLNLPSTCQTSQSSRSSLLKNPVKRVDIFSIWVISWSALMLSSFLFQFHYGELLVPRCHLPCNTSSQVYIFKGFYKAGMAVERKVELALTKHFYPEISLYFIRENCQSWCVCVDLSWREGVYIGMQSVQLIGRLDSIP